MPRLIDQIRAGGKLEMPFFVVPEKEEAWQRMAERLLPFLQNPQLPVLLIDNVAEYFYVGTGQEDWDLTVHFPNLAPPYPAFWCEHRIPSQIHSDRCGDMDTTKWIRGGRVGVLVHGLEHAEAHGEGIPDNAKWILWCELFIDYGTRIGWQGATPDRDIIATGPQGSMFMCIDEHGSLIGTPWMQSFCAPSEDEIMKKLMAWLHPTLLAISFLHCKNVRVDDNQVDKPLAKKWHTRHGQWPAPYKTLVIEPLKAILRTEGRSGEVGVPKAMHICRGHFRDYREGRGLFGKYHQLVWTPSVVRGTKGKQAPPREVQVKI